tara:strand:+ start:168 stop:617 length:450 start_codon:yes stop_codon:yes gene_type:complete
MNHIVPLLLLLLATANSEIIYDIYDISCIDVDKWEGTVSPCSEYFDILRSSNSVVKCHEVINGNGTKGFGCFPKTVGLWPKQKVTVSYKITTGTMMVYATQSMPPAPKFVIGWAFIFLAGGLCNYPIEIIICFMLINNLEMCSGVAYVY